MQVLHQTLNPAYSQREKRQTAISQFISWCYGQEQYRFGWLAIILAVHGCALTPATVLAISISGNSMILWSMAIGAMAMSLVTNLAAMPTKITIPVFFLSILIDLVAVAIGLNTFLHS